MQAQPKQLISPRGDTPISSIRTIDLRLVDELVNFIRGPGYVLDFSDVSFSEFFAAELNIDIDDPKYSKNGGSKGKRLRHFLHNCEDREAIKILESLWEHRTEFLDRTGADDPVRNAQARYAKLIDRLSGGATVEPQKTSQADRTINSSEFARISQDLMQVSTLAPQARGYAFEKFLGSLFSAFGLSARDPFRLRGEQIDGSFELDGEFYLLEAKWQSLPIGVSDLHIFQGKIDQKAAWTRGLFISNSGFTEEGLEAFGKGKRVVCMDGFDLYEMLSREISLPHVLKSKIRRAAETGSPFARVRDLFPN